MSLLMEALRRAEDAKNKSEDGSAMEGHADGPPKIDLSQIEDLELSDIQPAARGVRDGAAQSQSGVFSPASPTGEEALTVSTALDSGANQDQAQPSVPDRQMDHSDGASSQMTLEPLGRESQRAPDAVDGGELGVHRSVEHGADLIAEFDREFTGHCENPVTPHGNLEGLGTADRSPPQERASQPEPRAIPTPSQTREEVNSPAVQSTRKMPRAPVAPANESPARAAAVLAASGGENHRTRRLVLASVGALTLALGLGGGYVYYEQNRLVVSMVPHPPPASPLSVEDRNPLSVEASLATEPVVLEHVSGSDQDHQKNVAASATPLLETDVSLSEPTPEPVSLFATEDGVRHRSDESGRTIVSVSDLDAAAAEQKMDTAENTSASVVAPQPKPKPPSEVLQSGVSVDNITAPALPPVGPRNTFLSTQPPQQDLLHATLLSAYGAYQRGDDETARRLYQQALAQAPTNRDGLLGLAAVVLRKGDIQQAQSLYNEALRAYPGDKLATAGLLSLTAASDPVRAESDIKYLLAQDPNAAHLHFLLGNVYARQNNWSEAQAAYFNAYLLDNRNADYAFNLAVGLDRVGAHNQALSYYQTALQLASNGSASFDFAAVNQRLHRLERQLAKGSAP